MKSSRYTYLRDQSRRFALDSIDALFHDEHLDALAVVFDWGLRYAVIWAAAGGYPAVSLSFSRTIPRETIWLSAGVSG